MSLIDTHFYDGKIYITEVIRDRINKAQLISLDEKRRSAERIRSKLTELSSVRYLDIILADWGKESNYDPTNNIHTEDLLWLCENDMKDNDLKDNDLLKVLQVQLEEISLGSCPQGRVTRVFQAWISFQ